MARLLVPFILGACTSILGLVMLLAAMNGRSAAVVWTAFVLFIGVGPALCLTGLVLYASRRPSPEELARQRSDDMRTWQFRPVGLALFIGLLAVVSGLTVAAEVHWGVRLHGLGSRGFGLLLALPLFLLLSFRGVRRRIFYVADRAETSQTPGDSH
jgi:hypothetical protein